LNVRAVWQGVAVTPNRWRLDQRPVREIHRSTDAEFDPAGYPANIPVVAQLLEEGLALPAGVTFLVGENGSGKSTVVEAVAAAFGLDPEGGSPNTRHSTRATESPLVSWLSLTRGAGASKWGFFLRAESMHGYYTHLDSVGGSPEYHAMSHGESFLALVAQHQRYTGLWCLDEPEAALSFSSVLVLMGELNSLAQRGAQILCATHSPQLASLPGATILEVGEWGLRESAWEDLVLVANWRSYLDAPQRYLRHVLD
jgi:predicted ATPase